MHWPIVKILFTVMGFPHTYWKTLPSLMCTMFLTQVKVKYDKFCQLPMLVVSKHKTNLSVFLMHTAQLKYFKHCGQKKSCMWNSIWQVFVSTNQKLLTVLCHLMRWLWHLQLSLQCCCFYILETVHKLCCLQIEPPPQNQYDIVYGRPIRISVQLQLD